MSGISELQKLTFKNEFFKSPNSSKSKNFQSIGFDFESSKFMGIGLFVTIITVPFFVHWTCSLITISRQWCCCVGENVGEANVVHSLLSEEEDVSHYFLMLPLSFNTSHESMMV